MTKKRTTLYLDVDVWRKFKKKTVDDSSNVSKEVERMMKKFLR